FAEVGTELQCSELKGAVLERWLVDTTRDGFDKRLERPAAALLVELVGSELGLLSQEIAKLASYVGEKTTISADDARKVVGGWKAETTWVMLDSVRDGNTGFALDCMDKLLVAGEHPLKLLAGISFTFRKVARAVELSSQGVGLQTALRQAGMYPASIPAFEKHLRRMGRPKAERILEHLVNTDSGLKGADRLPERMQIERLLLLLSGRV
ncbi:MAG: DNA polymerase III subunit delta, partial [Planctomycetota bacterium]|nr:DNA polymerase III subunit delta [Planctomycetota bacterium]